MSFRIRSVGILTVLSVCAAVLVVLNGSAFVGRPSVSRPPLISRSQYTSAATTSMVPCSDKLPPSVEHDVSNAQEPQTHLSDGVDQLYHQSRNVFLKYYNYSLEGARLRRKHGPLRIAAFSRLWVPPLHGKGGMQYHALHLYSRLASFGHTVHVFVSGPSDEPHKTLAYTVDHSTLQLTPVSATDRGAQLVLHQVASRENGHYSEVWFHNVLNAYNEVNATVGGFHVAHSESWAGVANIYQIGLQMAVTWHGSMLDWFRNEINLIVHNFRVKGTMTSDHQATRMKDLGVSVAFESYALLTVPHHIVISDSAFSDLLEVNLIEAESVHLIYNGVNEANFRPNRDRRPAFLQKHGVPLDAFVVGCGGRLDGMKGHHQMSKAMDIFLRKHGDAYLLVAGSGAEGHRYEALKSQGLHVVLLGMMKQEDLAAFYQSLDVFVDPFYQHHGLNTVMIEATLSGVPLVATKLASAQTTVPNDAFGRTFQLGHIDDLVAAVEDLKLRPADRARIGVHVRERSLKLFTSTVMASSYETLLYDMHIRPKKLLHVTGSVVCKKTYPAMCYREPS